MSPIGILDDKIIAFGDSMNDKSMFEVAGLACIAMGNASDKLSNMQSSYVGS